MNVSVLENWEILIEKQINIFLHIHQISVLTWKQNLKTCQNRWSLSMSSVVQKLMQKDTFQWFYVDQIPPITTTLTKRHPTPNTCKTTDFDLKTKEKKNKNHDLTAWNNGWLYFLARSIITLTMISKTSKSFQSLL